MISLYPEIVYQTALYPKRLRSRNVQRDVDTILIEMDEDIVSLARADESSFYFITENKLYQGYLNQTVRERPVRNIISSFEIEGSSLVPVRRVFTQVYYQQGVLFLVDNRGDVNILNGTTFEITTSFHAGAVVNTQFVNNTLLLYSSNMVAEIEFPSLALNKFTHFYGAHQMIWNEGVYYYTVDHEVYSLNRTEAIVSETAVTRIRLIHTCPGALITLSDGRLDVRDKDFMPVRTFNFDTPKGALPGQVACAREGEVVISYPLYDYVLICELS